MHRSTKSAVFFFCPKDECIDSFHCEEDLIKHTCIDQHTTKEGSFSANDTAKVFLLDKSVVLYMIVKYILNSL